MERFISLNRIEGMPARWVNGIKNNHIPDWAVKGVGGNGQFLKPATPSKLILTYQDNAGKICSTDISNLAKKVNSWQKITDNRTEKLEKKFEEKVNFELMNLDEFLKI